MILIWNSKVCGPPRRDTKKEYLRHIAVQYDSKSNVGTDVLRKPEILAALSDITVDLSFRASLLSNVKSAGEHIFNRINNTVIEYLSSIWEKCFYCIPTVNLYSIIIFE